MSPYQLGAIIVVLAIIRGLIFLRQRSQKLKLAEQPEAAARIDGKFKGLNETLDSIIIAGVTALLLINFVIQTFYIPSSSMEPTLQIRDFILVNKFIYRFHPPARGDIMVFIPPAEAHADGKDYIKRIIGVGGDTVKVESGKVYRNGKALDEPYIAESIFGDFPEVKVPEDCFFAMGDNRNNSEDSRFWGFVPRKNVIGKAFVIFWPLLPNNFRARVLR